MRSEGGREGVKVRGNLVEKERMSGKDYKYEHVYLCTHVHTHVLLH